jgi:hypothetical protein
MKRTLICLAAGALLPASVALAEQQQSSPPAEQPQQQPQAENQSGARAMQQNQQSQQAPQGFVLLDERVVYLLANQPQQHFAAAVQKLQQKETQSAAAELRIAANYIDMQASRATGQFQQDRQALSQASQQLNQLADQVQKGKINSPDQLTNTFAKSNLALAKLFQAKSENDLQSNKYDMAGHALQNAALSFRQALVWSKQQPPRETMDVINNARKVASNLQSERMAMASQSSKSSSGSSQSSGAQPSGSQSARSEQSQSGNLSSQAQTASGNMNPITGTTPAEAQNIAQHARDVSQALGQQIDQYASKVSSGSQSAQSAGNAQQQSGAQSSSSGQGQQRSQQQSAQQQPAPESSGTSSSSSQ